MLTKERPTSKSVLADLSFPASWENGNPHDYYIPENILYRLCMKAKNEVATVVMTEAAFFVC